MDIKRRSFRWHLDLKDSPRKHSSNGSTSWCWCRYIFTWELSLRYFVNKLGNIYSWPTFTSPKDKIEIQFSLTLKSNDGKFIPKKIFSNWFQKYFRNSCVVTKYSQYRILKLKFFRVKYLFFSHHHIFVLKKFDKRKFTFHSLEKKSFNIEILSVKFSM
jgi:hypothetical protein